MARKHKAPLPGQKGRKPAPGKKNGRPPTGSPDTLTPAKWLAARVMWEADHRKNASFIADEFGTTIRAVNDHIKRDGWTREIHKQMVHVPAPPPPKPPWRPREFREEFADMLIDYFREAAFEVVAVEVVDAKDNRRRTKAKIVDGFMFPTMEAFADSIDVSAKTLAVWANEKTTKGELRNARFSEAFTRAKELQASILVRGGLAGVYNPAVSIFAAKNLLGWRNEVEAVDDSGAELYPAREALDEAYQRGLKVRAEQNAIVAQRKAKAR
ncbi:hypothetical protein [Nevskia ramosa]|uniref:hypothetical protein n=1 Tax=Nevskia ramosa TaxID=64002 RepID=UPI003D11B8C3